MYVLCTLVLLSLHSLFRRPRVQEPSEPKAIEGSEQHRQVAAKLGRKKRDKHHFPGSSGGLETSRVPRQHDFERCMDGPSGASKRAFNQDNVPERRKRAQVRLKMEIYFADTWQITIQWSLRLLLFLTDPFRSYCLPAPPFNPKCNYLLIDFFSLFMSVVLLIWWNIGCFSGSRFKLNFLF